MTRIGLIGRGLSGLEDSSGLAAAGLRTRQFASALLQAGHDLVVVAPAAGELSLPESLRSRLDLHLLSESDFESSDGLLREISKIRVSAAVGATSYCSFLLARSGYPGPIWVDFNGDPIAEGQAAAAGGRGNPALLDGWWMATWCLRRGDRFSTVSGQQRLATLGALGVSGRLNASTAGLDLVSVIPEAVAVSDAVPTSATAGPFTVLFSGSFNYWIDGETLAGALALAMRRNPSVRFISTGGGVAGYAEEPWKRFLQLLSELPGDLRDRVEILGWVDRSELQAIEDRAGCAVAPELQITERELGGQNRTLRWMARGIPVITTGLSELGRELERDRVGLTYAPGNSESLAQAILHLAEHRDRARELASRARRWIDERRSVAATTGPLVDWAASPSPAPDRSDGSSAVLAARQATMLADQLHLEALQAAGSKIDS